MCGIFGVLWRDSDAVPEEALLRETARLLQHRGPDDCGVHAAPGVGLVHTRLSLLDLSSRSSQPFWDRTRRYCLVYNGEIYNFAALRSRLQDSGVEFRTTSDTEVLLECLLAWGAETALPQLEGMFAFALYDTIDRSLLLARDRFGIKPLFLYDSEDLFAFTSEITAFRPWMRFQPDLPSISAYLNGFGGPTRGFTFFRNMRFLAPGGVVRLRKGSPPQLSQFFSLPEFCNREENERLRHMRPPQLIDRLDALLNRSIESQLIADAPVGGLCSGGVDSSLVLAIAKRYHGNLAIFHANVLGPESEYEAAKALAKYLRLDLQTADVRPVDLIAEMPEAAEHYGHPFYVCSHAIPFMLVSRAVRGAGVKAVLTGEGSDECFLGYYFSAPDVRRWLGIRPVLRLLKQAMQHMIGASRPDRGFEYYGPPFGDLKNIRSQRSLVTALHNRFEVLGTALDNRRALSRPDAGNPDKSVIATLNLLNYTLLALLHRNDTMGMAAGIESRFPFLDSEVVRFAMNLRGEYKVRLSPTAWDRTHLLFQDKWILRQVARRYLPREMSDREKKPFRVDGYDRGRLDISAGFFQQTFLADLFELSSREMGYLLEHASHDLKWKLVQLEVWAHVCLNGLPKADMTRRLEAHLTH